MVLVQQPGPHFLLAHPRPDLVRRLDVVTREAIETAMILCEGNVTHAARALGLKRTTLQARLAKYTAKDATGSD